MERESMLGENTGLEQLNLISKDVQASYIEEIGKIIPEVVTESRDENGKLTQSIDFDKLKGLLGEELSEQAECYEFTWVGKRGAISEAGRPTTKTLIPDWEESVEFEKTENVFITGDNLEVLKILQESYLNKIDMIYIDPPYNTGKDFVYSDKFQKTDERLKFDMDILDDAGRQVVGLTKNEKSSARYHSDWLNMLYSRLRLARNLLSEQGKIMISIDENEIERLKLVCNEIFGSENLIATFIWKKKQGGGNDSNLVVTEHEYIVCYAKDIQRAKMFLDTVYKLDDKLYPFKDESGEYGLVTLDKTSIQFSQSLVYEIKGPDGKIYSPRIVKGKQSCWRWGKEKVRKQYDELVFKNGKVYTKYYRPVGVTPRSLLIDSLYGRTESGSDDIKELFSEAVFSYPKPVALIKHFSKIGLSDGSYILDFFSGSATTAQAIMEFNAEDEGNRKFILCTLDEQVPEKSVAREAGYETIDQIARERIRRAAEKIKKEHPDRVGIQDFGFKAFKVASSNYKNVAATPSETTQSNLFDSVSNIKPDRTPLDLLYQVILSWGIELSIKVEAMQIESNIVYNVGEGLLLACFDESISESTVRQMAAQQPSMATFRDDSFGRSADKINLGEIFKELSPETKVKVI